MLATIYFSKQSEAMANNKAVTIVPSNTDIVSGRGRGFEKRKGNKMFRKLINSHSTVYSDKKTTRSQKGQIVQSYSP